MEAGEHHAHDVIAGASIGICEQLYFYEIVQRMAGGTNGGRQVVRLPVEPEVLMIWEKGFGVNSSRLSVTGMLR